VKPIRDYSDGQFLLLFWAFVVLFLGAAVLTSSRLVLAVTVLGALTACYTTYVYVADRLGRSPVISVFGREIRPPGYQTATRDDDSEGGTP
jgi:hypothetical protein